MGKNVAGGAFLVVGLLAGGALLGCGGHAAPPSELQGIVEHEERALAFELSGKLVRVSVRRGDVVTDGQVLAEIDDTLARLTRAARVDDAETARADLALLEAGAKREDIASLAAQVRASVATEGLLKKVADRARALRETGAIAQAEVDRADADLERATAERRSLEQRLASLQRGARTEELARARSRVEGSADALALEDQRLALHSLRAKGPGEVLDVHLEPGEVAAPGATVVTVADTARPYVEVFVPQGSLAGIRTGAKATIRVDATSSTFSGAVEHVSPRTEFTPRYIFSERERPNLVVRVRVRVDDPDRKMHAGVPAFVTILR